MITFIPLNLSFYTYFFLYDYVKVLIQLYENNIIELDF